MAVIEKRATAYREHRDGTVSVVPESRGSINPWTLRVAADITAAFVALAFVEVSIANVLFAVGAVVALRLTGTYRRQVSLSVLVETPWLLLGVGIPLMVAAALSPFLAVPSSLFLQALVTAVATLAGRTLTYAVIRRARRQGRVRETVVIVGAGAVGIELHRLLQDHPEYGMLPVGIVDDVAPEPELPLLGSLDELDQIIQDHGIRRVVVAFGPTGEQEMVAILRSTALLDVELHVVPRFFELGIAPSGPDVEQIWGIPIYRVRRAALTAWAWKVKRVVDVVVCGGLLVVLAPLFGAIALGVRLSSPGPAFFRQRRIGQDGTEIEVPKFRTLRVNPDADITWSVEDDPRQTALGRWLRALSLDELPQLWNVVRGDMALIGPRPERPHFVNRFSRQVSGYDDRHRLPVGVTGLAQVHGLRGDTSIAERARFDNYYIEHWSPWMDTRIMIRTVGVLLSDAYHGVRRQVARRREPSTDAADRPDSSWIEIGSNGSGSNGNGSNGHGANGSAWNGSGSKGHGSNGHGADDRRHGHLPAVTPVPERDEVG